jgi:membrane protein
MLTIDRTLNAIWRVRTPRPIRAAGARLMGRGDARTARARHQPEPDLVRDLVSKGIVGVLPGGVTLLLSVVEFSLLAGGLASLFHYVPNTHVRWRHALAGGVFAAAGFEFAKRLLGCTWRRCQLTRCCTARSRRCRSC